MFVNRNPPSLFPNSLSSLKKKSTTSSPPFPSCPPPAQSLSQLFSLLFQSAICARRKSQLFCSSTNACSSRNPFSILAVVDASSRSSEPEPLEQRPESSFACGSGSGSGGERRRRRCWWSGETGEEKGEVSVGTGVVSDSLLVVVRRWATAR